MERWVIRSIRHGGLTEPFLVPASALLHVPSDRQHITYHGLCITRALAAMRNRTGFTLGWIHQHYEHISTVLYAVRAGHSVKMTIFCCHVLTILIKLTADLTAFFEINSPV